MRHKEGRDVHTCIRKEMYRRELYTHMREGYVHNTHGGVEKKIRQRNRKFRVKLLLQRKKKISGVYFLGGNVVSPKKPFFFQ